MVKKFGSLLAIMMILLVSVTQYSFAEEANKEGKVILINMNRTNLINMGKIPSLNNEISKRGYIALMNVRGDAGTDDKRSIASMGAGARVNVSDKDNLNFEEINDKNSKVFKAATGKNPSSINNLNINLSINENLEKSQYASTLGVMGTTLVDNKLKVALLGNSDTIENDVLVKNRSLGLMAMDQFGRVKSGNVGNINVEDPTMPFGFRTDYNKLIEDTKTNYKNSDVLLVDLGDTYRLDNYKANLNEKTTATMQKSIYKNIDKYLNEVFNIVGENDVVYVISAFPSDMDYKNKRRLSPVIKFDGNGKGLLSSSTTRRDGIVGNVDIGVDILNTFGLNNKLMTGRDFTYVDKDNNTEFISDEYEKIVSISTVRPNILNGYTLILSLVWIASLATIVFRKRINQKYKDISFKAITEASKFMLIMPCAFLLSALFKFKTDLTIILGIVLMTLLIYVLSRFIFKNDSIKQAWFIIGLTVFSIVTDSVLGTFMMKNSIFSYDPIVGARYYGVGNEYGGITVVAAIMLMAILLENKKIPKWFAIVFFAITLLTSAAPDMGASVGGAIAQSMGYLLFILLIFNVKLNFKTITILGLAAIVVVGGFAAIDILTGSQSHLSLFINKIGANGISEIITTFSRKIQMNIKLAQTSIWVKVLLAGLLSFVAYTFIFINELKVYIEKHSFIYKGVIASLMGIIVSLLVNDSGIVAAATGSIYIITMFILIIVNRVIYDEESNI